MTRDIVRDMRLQLADHAMNAESCYRHGCPAAGATYDRAYARLKHYMQKRGLWLDAPEDEDDPEVIRRMSEEQRAYDRYKDLMEQTL